MNLNSRDGIVPDVKYKLPPDDDAHTDIDDEVTDEWVREEMAEEQK